MDKSKHRTDHLTTAPDPVSLFVKLLVDFPRSLLPFLLEQFSTCFGIPPNHSSIRDISQFLSDIACHEETRLQQTIVGSIESVLRSLGNLEPDDHAIAPDIEIGLSHMRLSLSETFSREYWTKLISPSTLKNWHGDSPSTCQIHNCDLEAIIVCRSNRRVLQTKEYYGAVETQFPNTLSTCYEENMTARVRGEVLACPECRFAERQWQTTG